jgi:hypothetical protein
MRPTYVVLAVISLALLPAEPLAQGSAPQLRLQALLTPEQVNAAGLHKLSGAELDSLNRYVSQLVLVAVTLSGPTPKPTTAPAPAPSSPMVIESRIDGEFTGWDGETIFKLLNGQVWQQSSYAYRYKYAYSPAVLIYQSGGLYKMKVDGVDTEITVRRLK